MSIRDILYNKDRHSMEIISMLFTLFYFFPLYFYEHLTFLFVVKILALYCFLMVVLLCCALLDLKKKLIAAYLLVLLSMATAGIHLGTNVFIGFAVFYMAFHQKPLWATIGLLYTIFCVSFAAYVFDLFKPYFILPTLFPTAVLFISGMFERKDRQHKRKEAQSRDQLEKLAAIAERERIARDLHDVLGHTLTSISLKSQLAEKLIDTGEIKSAKKEVAEVVKIISSTLSEVRQAISGYKSLTIEDRLVQLEDRLSEKGMVLKKQADFSKLNAKAESAVVLLLTEAVTNILRHSSADTVTITSRIEENQFRLSVCDNGQSGKIVMGNGLKGIRERVEALNGSFDIDNKAGFCLHIVLNKENLK